MTETDPTQRIARSVTVGSCPAMQTNVRWPAPVDQLLNEMIDQMAARGFECTRSQLIAALVATGPRDAETLESVVRDFKNMTAGSVVMQRRGPIVVGERRPGRRHR